MKSGARAALIGLCAEIFAMALIVQTDFVVVAQWLDDIAVMLPGDVMMAFLRPAVDYFPRFVFLLDSLWHLVPLPLLRGRLCITLPSSSFPWIRQTRRYPIF